MHSLPRLSLVGAGPGDPELITLKAIKTLQTADVVLYDALANEALLEYAPQHALLIFTGKRAGNHYHTQDEINEKIVHYAFLYGHVVRLKGGDPYVFGRGGEELEYAASFGIPTQYIPGISSALSVPGLSGIPLTKRGINESFWVVTGVLKDKTLSHDLLHAAKSSATVVVLMGMQKLTEIIVLFQQHRSGDEPVSIIQNGSKPDERSVTGFLNNILELQQQAQIGAPAIIIIGKVVAEKRFARKACLNQHLLHTLTSPIVSDIL